MFDCQGAVYPVFQPIWITFRFLEKNDELLANWSIKNMNANKACPYWSTLLFSHCLDNSTCLNFVWVCVCACVGVCMFSDIETFLHPCASLALCVADDLSEVIASDCKSIAVPVTELGPADLGVCHTLVVHVLDLRGKSRGRVRLTDWQIVPLTGETVLWCDEYKYLCVYKNTYGNNLGQYTKNEHNMNNAVSTTGGTVFGGLASDSSHQLFWCQ